MYNEMDGLFSAHGKLMAIYKYHLDFRHVK